MERATPPQASDKEAIRDPHPSALDPVSTGNPQWHRAGLRRVRVHLYSGPLPPLANSVFHCGVQLDFSLLVLLFSHPNLSWSPNSGAAGGHLAGILHLTVSSLLRTCPAHGWLGSRADLEWGLV